MTKIFLSSAIAAVLAELSEANSDNANEKSGDTEAENKSVM